MQYSIERNNQPFGPYELIVIQTYVSEGKILSQDKVVTTKGANVSVRNVVNLSGNQIQKGYSLSIPSNVTSISNAKIVAFLINSNTNSVLNA
jgi:hypothetical protein